MENLRGSIILQTFGVKYKHPCQEVENVVIPPYISPESVRLTSKKWPMEGNRDIFAFFRGKMEVNPKNVSGRFYSKYLLFSLLCVFIILFPFLPPHLAIACRGLQVQPTSYYLVVDVIYFHN